MKTIDLDAELTPLLTVKIGGKEYTVTDIDPKLMVEMSKVTDVQEGEGAITRIHDILSKVTGAPKEKITQLGIRKTNSLMRALLDAIDEEARQEANDSKKGPGAEQKQSTK